MMKDKIVKSVELTRSHAPRANNHLRLLKMLIGAGSACILYSAIDFILGFSYCRHDSPIGNASLREPTYAVRHMKCANTFDVGHM